MVLRGDSVGQGDQLYEEEVEGRGADEGCARVGGVVGR